MQFGMSDENPCPALQTHLDDGTTTLAWRWRVTRADGASFGFTDQDRTLASTGPTSNLRAGSLCVRGALGLGPCPSMHRTRKAC